MTPIEQVARAICAAFSDKNDYDPDELVYRDSLNKDYTLVPRWRFWMKEAEAALSAMPSLTPLNALAAQCHAANATWWCDPATGERLQRNKGELLMLIVSEVVEAMEGERKNLMDDHLPHRKMAEVELADVLIRLFDYAGAFGYDLDGALAEKRAYNAQRADHKPEARLAADGKKW